MKCYLKDGSLKIGQWTIIWGSTFATQFEMLPRLTYVYAPPNVVSFEFLWFYLSAIKGDL